MFGHTENLSKICVYAKIQCTCEDGLLLSQYYRNIASADTVIFTVICTSHRRILFTVNDFSLKESELSVRKRDLLFGPESSLFC